MKSLTLTLILALVSNFSMRVSPSPLCPRVTNCMLCGNCTHEHSMNASGTLLCHIEDVRPSVSLNWIQDGNLIITRNESYSMATNSSDGTWNSTATVEYSVPCGEEGVLACQITTWDKIVSTTVHVKSEICGSKSKLVNTSAEFPNNICPKRPIICWLLLITIIFVILVVIIVIPLTTLIRYRGRVLYGKVTYQDLKKDLKTIYSENIIPWIKDLSTNCQCLVKKEQFESCKSEKLLTSSFINTNDRVWFKGDPGVGKSFLFQQLLQKWIDNEIQSDMILIYFPLKGLSLRSSILHQLMQTLNKRYKSIQSLFDILRHHESVLLLDGLNDLPNEEKSSDTAHQMDNTVENWLTVRTLLKNTYKSTFPKLRLWISSRPGKFHFERPYNVVTLQGFTKTQLSTFFSSSSTYYTNIRESSDKRKNSQIWEITENTCLLAAEIEKLNQRWESVYSQQEKDEKKIISPLAAHLFVFNFFTTGKQIFPSPKSPFDISIESVFDVNSLFQVDWHLLSCLFRSCIKNEGRKKQARGLFQGKDVIFEKGKQGYSREAVTSLCMTCRESEIELKSLKFHKDYPPSLDKCIPSVQEELIFSSIKQDQEFLQRLICNLPNTVEIIRFISCKLPEEISIGKGKEIKVATVLREEDDRIYCYNFERKMWETDRSISEEETVEHFC